MFVKICGVTHPADARAAVAAGADAIGLNFVSTSRRGIDIQTARAIVAVIPDEVMTVGVFRNHCLEDVAKITSELGLDAAQLHGDEPPEVVAAVAAQVETVIKVVAADSRSIQSTIAGMAHAADIVMLDAAVPGGGVPFDWVLVGDLVHEHRILLAGGLRPDNVAEAVETVRPWGVDVATGVEAADGRKDPAAIARFVARARSAAIGTGTGSALPLRQGAISRWAIKPSASRKR